MNVQDDERMQDLRYRIAEESLTLAADYGVWAALTALQMARRMVIDTQIAVNRDNAADSAE